HPAGRRLPVAPCHYHLAGIGRRYNLLQDAGIHPASDGSRKACPAAEPQHPGRGPGRLACPHRECEPCLPERGNVACQGAARGAADYSSHPASSPISTRPCIESVIWSTCCSCTLARTRRCPASRTASTMAWTCPSSSA